MVGIIILCVIALMLAVLLLTPVRARFSYDRGDLAAWVRYGPAKLEVYPRKEVPEEEKNTGKKKKSAKRKKKSVKEEEDEAKEEKGKTLKRKISKEQILYSLETLPPILGRALRRTRRRIRLNPLKIHLLIASPDPADTALLYGKLEAALAVGLPALHRLVRIKEQDIRLFPDFAGESMDCIADVGIAIRPWDLLAIGIPAGASLIKWLLRCRKLAPPAPEEKKDENATTEAA